MRLYLSSFRLGSCGHRLHELTRGGRRAAVIANAMDAATTEVRAAAVELEVVTLEELGFVVEEIDLREHVAGGEPLERRLRDQDLVWVRGGNVFVLRHAVARARAEEMLTGLLAEDALVYGGYSAGPCVLGPSLRGLEAVDDVAAVGDLYGEEPIWSGLAVLDHAFVPHVDSPDHGESEALGRVAEEYRRLGVRHRSFRDGEVLVIDGEREFVCPIAAS